MPRLRWPELALDDVQWDALACEFDGVCVTELTPARTDGARRRARRGVVARRALLMGPYKGPTGISAPSRDGGCLVDFGAGVRGRHWALRRPRTSTVPPRRAAGIRAATDSALETSSASTM